MQTTETLRIDDLQPEHWYTFRTPLGPLIYAQWRGFDGHAALIREADSDRDEPLPCRFLACCDIAEVAGNGAGGAIRSSRLACDVANRGVCVCRLACCRGRGLACVVEVIAMAKKKTQTPEKRSWLVLVRKTVEVEVVTDDCTKEEARSDPEKFFGEESEIACLDFAVLSVKPND
jgi:hypothetical protein